MNILSVSDRVIDYEEKNNAVESIIEHYKSENKKALLKADTVKVKLNELRQSIENLKAIKK